MIVLVASLKAKAGKEKKVEEILKAMVPLVQNEKGALNYIFHRSKADPGSFMFYEQYADKAALELHGATTYFKQLGKDLAGLLDGAPVETFYEVLAAITR